MNSQLFRSFLAVSGSSQGGPARWVAWQTVWLVQTQTSCVRQCHAIFFNTVRKAASSGCLLSNVTCCTVHYLLSHCTFFSAGASRLHTSFVLIRNLFRQIKTTALGCVGILRLWPKIHYWGDYDRPGTRCEQAGVSSSLSNIQFKYRRGPKDSWFMKTLSSQHG